MFINCQLSTWRYKRNPIPNLEDLKNEMHSQKGEPSAIDQAIRCVKNTTVDIKLFVLANTKTRNPHTHVLINNSVV